MQIVGKCPPTEAELRAAAERGFGAVELHLTTEKLDTMEETVAVCRDAPVEIASVHTPHVSREQPEYIQLTNDLCERLDATLVFHSIKVPLSNIDYVLDQVNLTVPTGFENSTGHSTYFLKNTLFEEGLSLTLDTAHFYTAEAEFFPQLETLLTEYGDSIPVVHCCDGTRTTDGLEFGTGTMEMERLISLLDDCYDGIVVLEVMPHEQDDALAMVEDVLGRKGLAAH